MLFCYLGGIRLPLVDWWAYLWLHTGPSIILLWGVYSVVSVFLSIFSRFGLLIQTRSLLAGSVFCAFFFLLSLGSDYFSIPALLKTLRALVKSFFSSTTKGARFLILLMFGGSWAESDHAWDWSVPSWRNVLIGPYGLCYCIKPLLGLRSWSTLFLWVLRHRFSNILS